MQRGAEGAWSSRCTSKLTEDQYASPAGMCRSSESLKMPFLKTSFESLAPMLAALRIFALCGCEGLAQARRAPIKSGADQQACECCECTESQQGSR